MRYREAGFRDPEIARMAYGGALILL